MNAWKMLQLSTLSVAVLLQETISNTCVCPSSFRLLRTYLKFQLRLILKVQAQWNTRQILLHLIDHVAISSWKICKVANCCRLERIVCIVHPHMMLQFKVTRTWLKMNFSNLQGFDEVYILIVNQQVEMLVALSNCTQYLGQQWISTGKAWKSCEYSHL